MFFFLQHRPEACPIRCSRGTRQNYTKTSYSFSYNTYVSYRRRSFLKIPNKAIYSVFWDNVNLPLPFPSKVKLGSWSAFSDGLNLSFFFFWWLPIFIKAIQKKNDSLLCRLAVRIATLHKETVLDLEQLKIYRSEI